MEREELAYKRELIKAHEKRLRELEIQAAIKGVNTPAETKTEIKDISDAIEDLERDIKKGQFLGCDDVDYREKRKILIIDDDVEWVNELANKLSEWGYDVIVAFKGVDGIRLATIERPDVVLLDLYMPDMHGHNVLLKIAERRVATRIIILSGIENIGISVLIKSGACDYINKSEGFERLKFAIERAIELVPTVDVIIEHPLSIINPLLIMVDDLLAKRQLSDKNREKQVRERKGTSLQKSSTTSKKRVTGKSYGLSETNRLIFAKVYRLRAIASNIKNDLIIGVFNQDEYGYLLEEYRELSILWHGEGDISLRPDPHMFMHDLYHLVGSIRVNYGLLTEDLDVGDLKQISNLPDGLIGHLDRFYAYLLDNAEIEL